MTSVAAPRPTGTGASRAVLATTVTWSRWIVGATVLGSGALALLGPATDPAWERALVLGIAGAGVVAGLPHGAVDHVLASRLGGRPLPAVTAAYAAAAVAAWALLWWGGPVLLLAAVALSIAHFGAGELEVHRASGAWRPGRVVAVATALAGTGALLLPLARSDETLLGVAAAISPGLAAALSPGPVRVAVAGLWLLTAVVAGIAAWRAGQRAVVGDVLLVGALGLLAPPVVAFAVWFGGWHALRHTGRLLTVEPGCAEHVAAGRPGSAVRRLARLAALPSAAALTTLAVITGVTVAAPDPGTALAEALRVLLALTVPHMIVVGWLDRRGRDRQPRAPRTHPGVLAPES